MNGIHLSYEQRKQLRDEIHDFYMEERGEDIGVVHQEGILELFMERLAPMIYRNAFQDARVLYQEKPKDLARDYAILNRSYLMSKNEIDKLANRIECY